MVKVKRFLNAICYFPIYLISFLIRKKTNLWVFGAWFGYRYSDNSKYLFEYCNQITTLRCIWLSRDKKVIDMIRDKGFESYRTNSIKGIYFQLIAKVGVVCTGKNDINPYFVGKSIKLVNLWHGTPLKKIMNDDKITFKAPKGILSKIFPVYSPTNYSLICASSEEVATRFKTAFKLNEEVVITGYSRNDFASKLTIQEKEKKFLQGVYLPTHRGEGDSDFLVTVESMLKKLDEILEGSRIQVDVKLHFYYQTRLASVNEYQNIRFLKDADIDGDIYSALWDYDFLITDYSSIYFDFLLKDKPIIFYPFDLNSYLTKDREMYYNYEEVTPGPKVTSYQDLFEELIKVRNGQDTFREQRRELNAVFNKFNDGLNSGRIVQEIMELI
ncbi:MAG: CDP-glycerol glycerophosphotransferase family protein [Cyclobacteriaceae bacterium]